ncbi:MAG: carbohydrate kinase family protein [Acidimicrobiales bacterium]
MSGTSSSPGGERWDLLVVGELNLDVIVQGAGEPQWGQAERLVDEVSLVLGGSGAITAAGAARLGLRTALAAGIGEDRLGEALVEALVGLGVDTSPVVRDSLGSTGSSIILTNGGDRAILTFPGTVATRTLSDLDLALVDRARHVHISSYFLQAGVRERLATLLAAARAAGASISLDPNGDPAGAFDPAILDLLRPGELLLVNEAEAETLANSCRSLPGRSPSGHAGGPEADGGIERTALSLAARGPVVVVKRGAAGALWSDGRRVASAPSPVVDVVDAIGAGDSFAAAFVASTLAGIDIERCLQIACRAGALSTRRPGGTAGQADRFELGLDLGSGSGGT